MLKRGDIVIYESTVYPGATEEDCVPVLERISGLKFNEDFFCGYSPERINPGDKAHRLTTILKVTSGSTPEVTDAVDALYASIVTAGTYKAQGIRVAEAAKVIENNHVWSYDFVEGRTHDGRRFRMLNVIDEFTRECLANRGQDRHRGVAVLLQYRAATLIARL